MIKKIKQLMIVAAFSVVALTPLAVSGIANAQVNIEDGLCGGAQVQNPGTGNCSSTSASGQGVTDLATDVINLLSWVVGVISVIMIIVGGFRYITSGGASEKVTGAKNTIIYAVIGLVIVALAQFIVNFVLAKTIDVTN